jgi:hypothetical protein
MSLQATVLLLTHIAFALLTFAALLVKAVTVVKAVVLIIFTVYIKSFKRLLRLVSIA